MSESVAQKLEPPHWLPIPEHSSPLRLRGRMGSERIQRASERIKSLNCRRGPDPGPCSHLPHPFLATQQGNGVQGSAYCSASLRAAADYDLHECQALKLCNRIFSTLLGVGLHVLYSYKKTHQAHDYVIFMCTLSTYRTNIILQGVYIFRILLSDITSEVLPNSNSFFFRLCSYYELFFGNI